MTARKNSALPARILVVDDDQLLSGQVSALLLDAGAEEVHVAHDGESGWEMALAGDFGLFIIDWKLPLLSGLALFNRIRGVDRLLGTPVLVVSGLVKRMDFRLLQEFPCTQLLEKPFTHSALVKSAVELQEESEWYVSHLERMDGLLQTLKADPSKAVRDVQAFVSDSPNPQPLGILAARKLREHEHYEEAIVILKGILATDRSCIPAISELGRCLHLLGRYDEALQFLRRADQMAPANIERLGLMGEVELNNVSAEGARRNFDEVLKIDRENKRARQGLRAVDTLAEMMHRPASVHIKDTFASLMNTIAVNLAHSGNYSSAVSKYEEAFHFIGGREDSSRVAFNVGLAYLRWGKDREALDWFEESSKRGRGKFIKAHSYVEKLTQRLADAAARAKAEAAAEAAAAEAALKAAQEEEAKAAAKAAAEKKEGDGKSSPQHEQPK
jgi:two-component system chemotaxis response regulator CheY